MVVAIKLLILSTFAVGLFIPGIVSAHELAEDQSVAAVLHINPNDKPIVDQSQNLIFTFKDLESKFNLNDCLCSVKIFKDSVLLADFNPKAINPTISENDYTFQDEGRHYINLNGSSKTGSFDNFEINYQVYVEAIKDESEFSINKTMLAIIFGNILLLILCLKFYKKF